MICEVNITHAESTSLAEFVLPEGSKIFTGFWHTLHVNWKMKKKLKKKIKGKKIEITTTPTSTRITKS